MIPVWVHPKLTINFDEVPETILQQCSSKAYTLSEVLDGKFHEKWKKAKDSDDKDVLDENGDFVYEESDLATLIK